MRTALLILGFLSTWTAAASEFDHPWNDPRTALVLDAYCANSIDWILLAGEPRVAAIIHKATTGTRKLDPAYRSRRLEARSRGYLWGSYHLGLHGNPERQADHYLDTVRPAPDELLALDLEDLHSRKFMNATEAIRFIKRVKQRLGRYPVVYGHFRTARILSEQYPGTVFAQTPLWYANFKGSIEAFPAGLWPTYALWQFSSEIHAHLGVPGTLPDMDINVFNGTVEELKNQWPFTWRHPAPHPGTVMGSP